MNPDPNDTPAAGQPGPTGPRTEEGKKRTRFNAVRHGLTGQNVVFTEEESPIYAAHSRGINEHYLPTGPIEESLVRLIADCIWRQDRATSIEHGIFALSLCSQAHPTDLDIAGGPAQTWREECKELALLTLYVKRIDNKLAAHKAELKAVQQERRDAERQAAQESSEAAIPQPSPQTAPLASRPPAPAPESVFSPVPVKPAAVPVKPKIDVPGTSFRRKPDAA